MHSPSTPVSWTDKDLDLLPDNGSRYEIIDGELFVTRALHFRHQKTADRICTALNNWSDQSGLGEAASAIGIVFSDTSNVIADVIWATHQRLAATLDEAGHLTAAPELIVEVLSLGQDNERRDREVKLKLYTTQGVLEYWIVDRFLQQIQIYRRDQATLKLIATLYSQDEITSPLLPGFQYPIA